ncbi:MAG: nucleotidyltransferase domain-containing protein [Endomicrobiia bacterium]
MRYFDLLKKKAETRKMFLENLDYYLKLIKEFFVKKLGKVDVYVFGSVLRKDFTANSDIDILVVCVNMPEFSYKKAKLLAELKKVIGFVNPFEIHMVTEEEYKNWYCRFIKEKKLIY